MVHSWRHTEGLSGLRPAQSELRAGCGSLFLQEAAKLLFLSPPTPCFLILVASDQQQGLISLSLNLRFLHRKALNSVFPSQFVSSCDVEVSVALKNPIPVSEEAVRGTGQQHGSSQFR